MRQTSPGTASQSFPEAAGQNRRIQTNYRIPDDAEITEGTDTTAADVRPLGIILSLVSSSVRECIPIGGGIPR